MPSAFPIKISTKPIHQKDVEHRTRFRFRGSARHEARKLEATYIGLVAS
jgi:hypothetical protein